MSLRLGKRAAAPKPTDFQWRDLAATLTLPTLPARFGHANMFSPDWGMYGNGPDDTVQPGFSGCGDCVWAGFAHETRMLNKLVGGTLTPFTGKCVVSDYSAETGYIVGNDATDQGTDVHNALGYRQKTGIVDGNGNRHQIGAYVALDPGNWQHLLEAVYIFGNVGIGFEFPNSAWAQFDAGQPWDVVANDGGIDGGHYVPVMGTPGAGLCGLVTWAKRQVMTEAFYKKYNDEAWTYISQEELNSTGVGLHGFNVTLLNEYLAALAAKRQP